MALTGFDHNVTWSEFTERSSRPSGFDEDARIRTQTVSGGFRSRQRPGDVCRVVSIDIGLSVDRSISWVVNGRQSDWLLRHEQGHFDIVALGTRELYDRVLQLTAPRCDAINTLVEELQQEIQARIDATDDRYDTQTTHGTDSAPQQTWESRIRTAKQSPNGRLADLPQ